MVASFADDVRAGLGPTGDGGHINTLGSPSPPKSWGMQAPLFVFLGWERENTQSPKSLFPNLENIDI